MRWIALAVGFALAIAFCLPFKGNADTIVSGQAQPSPPWTLQVSRGLVPGWSFFDKFGLNPEIDLGQVEAIWKAGGLYTGFPTNAAETMEVRSSATNDTGTLIVYNLLDEDGDLMDPVTNTLTGTSWVSLGTQKYYRGATRMIYHPDTSTTNVNNIGQIACRWTTTTNAIFGTIEAGDNQTEIAMYTVPKDHTLYLNAAFIRLSRSSGAAGSAEVDFLIRTQGSTGFRPVIAPIITDASSFEREGSDFLPIPAMTDIKFETQDVSDNNSIITAEMSGYLHDQR